MQIHELNAFSGTTGSSDYFAVDNGTETFKVAGNSIYPSMTQSQAASGTSTTKMVITPSIFKSAVLAIARTISNRWVDISDAKVDLDTTAAAGTIDGNLYITITAHGWENSVIQ